MRTTRGFWRGVSLFLGFWLLLLGLVLPSIGIAAETGWPLSHDAGVTVAFGATYVGPDGRGSTHRGVDITGAAGDDVLAPSSGEVRFVGRVPASAGGTQLAATILRPDGVSMTFMPLSDACVSAGDTVSAGQRIAALATDGDGSSPSTHLHVGARRGDLYVDPMQFLTAPPATAAEPPAVETPAPAESAGQGADTAPDLGSVKAPAPVQMPAESLAAPVAGEAGTVAEPAEDAVGAEPEAQSRGVTEVSSVPDATWVSGGNAVRSPLAADVTAAASRVAASLALGSAGVFAPATGGTDLLAAPVPNDAMDSIPTALAGNLPLAAPGPTIAAASARELSAQGLRLPSAASVASAVRRVGRAWLLALLGSLAGAGALWPLWRRSAQPHEEELRCCIAPGGTDVAAAAGR